MFLSSMGRSVLQVAVLLLGASLVLAFGMYAITLWIFRLRPISEFAGIEGLLFILAGICFLLGSGGISANTAKAAILASAAKAIGKGSIGPAEVFRKDTWKPKGHVLLGLAMILAGAILIVLSLVWL